MKLTWKQWRILTAYRKWHQSGLSLWRVYRSAGWRIVVPLAVAMGAAAFCFAYGGNVSWFGLVFVGIGFGFFARDFGSSLQSVAVWPVIDRVTDWDRVDQLLNEVGSPPPRGIPWITLAGTGMMLVGGFILVRADRTKPGGSANK